MNSQETVELEAQEARLVLPRFTYEDAWTLGTLLVGMARERQAPVAIDIRRGAQQLFHCALPGPARTTTPGSTGSGGSSSGTA